MSIKVLYGLGRVDLLGAVPRKSGINSVLVGGQSGKSSEARPIPKVTTRGHMRAFFKVVALTAALIAIPGFNCRPAAAQTSGVGADGNTRFLWRGTDGSLALWELDPQLTYLQSHAYGPYLGWTPSVMTAGNNNFSYVLWRRTDGATAIWVVDPQLNFFGAIIYNPIAGWTAESLSTDVGSTNLRLTWKRTDGAAAIYILDQNLNTVGSATFGPFFGYDPGAQGQAPLRTRLSGQASPMRTSRTTIEADRRAAAAMKEPSSSKRTLRIRDIRPVEPLQPKLPRHVLPSTDLR